jgi:hypothetical protein
VRFCEELELLKQLSEQAPPEQAEIITKVYGSGFVPVKVPKAFELYDDIDLSLPIHPTGLETESFVKLGEDLQRSEPDQWRPYLVVEMADYDGSLLRQINGYPSMDDDGAYRLPTGEVIYIAWRLLNLIEWLHTSTFRRAYIDWKPEHIHWAGGKQELKLIDWNVTEPLDAGPGERQNIRDDVRLFCGALLYSALTMVDMEDKPMRTQPTTDYADPTPQARRRYWTEEPSFYKASYSLDRQIKEIVLQGVTPSRGYSKPADLRDALLSYAQKELDLKMPPPQTDDGTGGYHYWQAIQKVRRAQLGMKEAYNHLTQAIEIGGRTDEVSRLGKAIRRTFNQFPAP